jgi:nucleobase:cation symporter-1, NCS1 family
VPLLQKNSVQLLIIEVSVTPRTSKRSYLSLVTWLFILTDTPSSQYIQLIIIPTAFTLCAFFGLAVTSAGQTLYGATIWDPTHLVDRWSNRPAAFFVSFSFAIASLGTNISANTLSAGNDLSAIAPRWINIRRGQVICAVLGGWAFCPWEILAKQVFFSSRSCN